jgi:phage baseplate assembly protein W
MALRNFLGVGYKFPFSINKRGGVAMSRYEEDIEESIVLIVGTAFGERQMRPDFGCGIHDLVFAPNNTNTRSLAVYHIEEALVKWEPRIVDLKILAKTEPEEPNVIYISIDYKVRTTNNVFNMVYPFYLQKSEV